MNREINRKSIYIALTVSLIIGVILTIILFDTDRISMLLPVIILVLIAFVVAKFVQNSVLSNVIIGMLYPVFSPFIIRYCSDTKAIKWLCSFYTFVFQGVMGFFGKSNAQSVPLNWTIGTTFFIPFLFFLFVPLISKNKSKDEKDPEFIKKRDTYCKNIEAYYKKLNKETNWNDETFTPIEAEVQVYTRGKQNRKISDLLTCLKKARKKSSVVLVLGDPGSGKSVSMRKLCSDLLKETKKTGVIPVYINLKQWNTNWTIDASPNVDHLLSFIRNNMNDEIDDPDNFLDQYFEKMRQNGKWYFIFDSFDELPCLMGRKNCRELIDQISALLYRFMKSTGQNGGVIASRKFHSPTAVERDEIIVELQEFDDYRIKIMLERYLGNADKIVNQLFKKREDLVSLCRNPFTLSLFICFIQDGGTKLPNNQLQLYEHFIETRIKRKSEYLEEKDITSKQVVQAAEVMADYMYDLTDSGLECSIQALKNIDSALPWDKAIDVLNEIKLCRVGGRVKSISFVHRRFQEFFWVQNLLKKGYEFEIDICEDIPNLIGLRDALVLYCEIVGLKKLSSIVNYCWEIVKDCQQVEFKNRTEIIRVTNTLYFMAEALRNPIVQFGYNSIFGQIKKDFGDMISELLSIKTPFVIRLAAANCIALIEPKRRESVVYKAFMVGDPLLNDNVMKCCRLIPKISLDLEFKFRAYFRSLPLSVFLRRFRAMQFSMSLSKNMRKVRIIHRFVLAQYIVSLLMPLFKFSHVFFCSGIEAAISLNAFDFIFVVYLCLSLNFYHRNRYSYKRINSYTILSLYYFISWTYWILYLPILSSRFYVFNLFLLTILTYIDELLMLFTMTSEYKSTKKKLFCLIDYIITKEEYVLIILSSPVMVFYILIQKASLKIRNPFGKYVSYVLYGIGIVAIVIVLVSEIVKILIVPHKDRQFIKKQPRVNIISRKKLYNNLATIRTSREALYYVERLVEDKVELTGEWPADVDDLQFEGSNMTPEIQQKIAILDYVNDNEISIHPF